MKSLSTQSRNSYAKFDRSFKPIVLKMEFFVYEIFRKGINIDMKYT